MLPANSKSNEVLRVDITFGSILLRGEPETVKVNEAGAKTLLKASDLLDLLLHSDTIYSESKKIYIANTK